MHPASHDLNVKPRSAANLSKRHTRGPPLKMRIGGVLALSIVCVVTHVGWYTLLLVHPR